MSCGPHPRLLCVLGLITLSACPAELHQAPGSSPRGVLLVVVDTLRADHVGVYGSPQDLTPHIDSFASESLVFRNTIAASSWTRPSVASIFTSLYPTVNQVLGQDDSLSDGLETIAETVSAAGLRTFAVSSNANAGTDYGFDQGFDLFVKNLRRRSYPGERGMVPAERITRRALEIVDSLGSKERFFLFLHYIDPHMPYLQHADILPEPEPPGRFDGSRSGLRRLHSLNPQERTSDDIARIKYLYSGEVKYCDRWLGKLFDGLSGRGLLDRLLIILTSDHGEGLWDHGVRGHGKNLHGETVRVPLIVRFPQPAAHASRHIDWFTSHVDIAPTILGALGLPLPDRYQGRDLGAAARQGRLVGPSSFAYSEMNHKGVDLESISSSRQKLIRSRAFDGNEPPRRRNDLVEWYDLIDDPRESRNLSRSAEVRQEPLYDIMRRIGARNLRRRIAGDRVAVEDLDPETLEELKALGYLG